NQARLNRRSRAVVKVRTPHGRPAGRLPNLAPCSVTKVGTYGETPFELFKSAGWRAAPSPADNCINPRIAGSTRGIREAGRADRQPAGHEDIHWFCPLGTIFPSHAGVPQQNSSACYCPTAAHTTPDPADPRRPVRGKQSK